MILSSCSRALHKWAWLKGDHQLALGTNAHCNRSYFPGVVGLCICELDEKGAIGNRILCILQYFILSWCSSAVYKWAWLGGTLALGISAFCNVILSWCSRVLYTWVLFVGGGQGGSVCPWYVCICQQIILFGVVGLYTLGVSWGASVCSGYVCIYQYVIVFWCRSAMYTWGQLAVGHLPWVCFHFSAGNTIVV